MCCWPVCDSVEEGLQQSVWERDLPRGPASSPPVHCSPLALCTLPATRQVRTRSLVLQGWEALAHALPSAAEPTTAAPKKLPALP